MHGSEMKGRWKELKGKVKQKWGELTDDELDTIEGDRDRLVGRIQQRYGRKRGDAEREVDEFLRKI